MLDATVGGHVEIGDNIVGTAIKEVSEETGAKISENDLHLIKITRTNSEDKVTGKKNNTIRTVFAYKYVGNIEDLKQEDGEGAGFESYSIEKLENLTDDERNKFIILSEDRLLLFKEIKREFAI